MIFCAALFGLHSHIWYKNKEKYRQQKKAGLNLLSGATGISEAAEGKIAGFQCPACGLGTLIAGA
ncbi:MAG: hypothetical protein CRN43_01410 [Candidatus Nephrothrix sp. EaCA]|nr:MAG: hypothetical protein CRN43_01410 [Candidatus Nephrothrix sp. EaCA]